MSNTDRKLVEVVIDREGHTHAGKPCEKGEKIKVTPRQKAWMEKHKVIKSTGAQAPAEQEG
ncbi:MAG: hypothetical protein JJU06_05755 [Ectothiorhodospiraceae bacterium]|nr:hypothetical protein [Ectothiorhodospiraceae bacterium]MCH8502920.1 hypothetical protein [Ectothiorhodospiraceae bacterium]